MSTAYKVSWTIYPSSTELKFDEHNGNASNQSSS